MKRSITKSYIIKLLLAFLLSLDCFACAPSAWYCLLSQIGKNVNLNKTSIADTKPFNLSRAQINDRYVNGNTDNNEDPIESVENGPNEQFETCSSTRTPASNISTASTFSNFGTSANGSDIFTYDENLSDIANTENATTSPRPSSSVNTALPDGDPAVDGFYRYDDEDNNFYGTNSVIWQLQEAGKKLAANGMSMGIGDISKRGGGYLSPHQTHRDGKSVDMRFLGSDGQATQCVYTNRCYSRENTKVMLETLINVNPNNVKTIYLNDPILREEMKVKFPNINFSNCAGHDNHLHVNFKE